MKGKFSELLLFQYFAHFIFLLAVIILLGGYLIFIKPNLALLRPGAALDVASYQNILDQEKSYLAKVENLEKKYNSLDATRIEKLDFLMSSKLDEPSLLYLFEAINNKVGVKPDSFTYSSGKGVTRIKINFSNKDYSGFKNYLKALEDSIRLLDVESVQMSVTQSNYSLEIAAYYIE
ncbi:MAG: hypothetical protein PHV78_01435 [Patescibacteria group bacterium]|nr:hypothetical protein [Patescibacteria group bacterium]MDD5121182.1 hypothetical protein [Patescibacteria group bacterium]MDD5221994.1 hypothetical protein [Patescibacteria group bacterium]MDD5395899.1 hypothetical protein [Patescibacteria group bacterium]